MTPNYAHTGRTLITPKCIPLDREIENFRRRRGTVDDPVALALIAIAIGKLESEKAAMHPEKE